jgi:uncharacterized protein
LHLVLPKIKNNKMGKFSNTEKERLKTKYGPWAVVTGASSGIGLELANRLAEAGFSLVLNARNQANLNQISQDLRSQYGIETLIIPADMASAEGPELVIAQTQHLNVGLFIASAGFGTSGSFIGSTLGEEINMLRVNCEALLVLTHHFSQRFVANKRGGIILMSSLVSFQGVPNAANYAATKAYVQSLAEGLYHELKPYNVDVLAAAPGPVNSGFGKRANLVMNGAASTAQIGIPILKALGRQQVVLPGFLSKFLTYSLRMVPRWGKVRIMKLVMGGMTKHQG